MLILPFLADLEMLRMGINVEGGHLLHGGHFGLNYTHLIMQCTRCTQRTYHAGSFGTLARESHRLTNSGPEM